MTTTPKTALITGAAKRIGKSIALSLAENGWDIAIHYHHSEKEAEELAVHIRNLGRKAITVAANLTNEEEVKLLLPTIGQQLSPVTCLVNNASIFENDTLATNNRTSWDRHMEANLRAPLVLIQDFAAQLPKEVQGNVINILDYAVWSLPRHSFLSYIISKSALWTLTQTLALTLAPHIRMNAIGPGPALANIRQSAEGFAETCLATPLGYGSSPEEIAKTIQFILSSPSMTGQMIALDGGRHLERAEYL